MLSDLLVAALSCLLPLATIAAYRCGLRDGRAMRDGGAMPRHGTAPRGHVETADKTLDTLLYNIDNYDGTEAMQRDL